MNRENGAWIFIPPVKKTTGGVAVLLELARSWAAAGIPVRLAVRESVRLLPGLPHVLLGESRPEPGDLWLVPEGWPNALAPGLGAGARSVLYVQNWAYLFSALPDGRHLAGLELGYLAVSDPVRHYIRQALGPQVGEVPVLRPAVDTELFRPPASRAPGPLRVAFMPRKNRALAEQIRKLVELRRARAGRAPLDWLAIENLSRSQVAEALARADVFLATGFPEGCPLPPLEALASGCLVAGYAGFGGTDYLRQAGEFPGALKPWWPLRPVDWGPNGLLAADADVLGAAQALEQACDWLERGDPRAAQALAAGQQTAAAYAPSRFHEAALAAWQALTADAN